MGRLVGFEPTHIGTTIRGLNRLTTDAISCLLTYHNKKIPSVKTNGIFYLYDFIP